MVEKVEKDMAAKPMPFMWSWGVPMLFIFSTNFMGNTISQSAIVLLIFGLFVWMGIACLLNAQRCQRRHCYYSGPIFLLGAIMALLVGFKIVDFGRDGLSVIINLTLLGALATYGSELIWGRYLK